MDPNNENRNSGKVKNWFTWALLALLPGLTGWFIVLTQEQIQQNRSETYKQISRQQKDEFLRMYQDWSRLTPQEKADNPWGVDPYGGPTIQKKLLQNQEERLLADLPELLSENAFPSELGDILYGAGWRGKLQEYQKQIEYREILSICSWILVITGILGFGIGLLLWIAGKVTGSRSRESAEAAAPAESSPAPGKEEPGESAEADKTEEVHLFTQKRSARYSSSTSMPPPVPPSSSCEESQPDSPAQPSEPAPVPAADASASGPSPEGSRKHGSKKNRHVVETASVINEVLAEEDPAPKDPAMLSLMTPEPVALELTDLTEQMSAIREFAAEQQTQVKKLQDGYDWMLIKRFCLRIIRCIDNIDDRIRQLAADQKETSAMEDVRDEMVFALESSGVEPFEPDIGQPYRGLEKYAEAIKDRRENDDPEKSGTIAEIIRPGYQYLISDEEVKIVRCAQVKLYT
jgi:molecular chaperone GrpE (heat shock protein)